MKVFQADLTKQKTDATSLTTDLAKTYARNAELERDLKRTHQDLTTPKTVARVTSTSVFGIEWAVTNLTR